MFRSETDSLNLASLLLGALLLRGRGEANYPGLLAAGLVGTGNNQSEGEKSEFPETKKFCDAKASLFRICSNSSS